MGFRAFYSKSLLAALKPHAVRTLFHFFLAVSDMSLCTVCVGGSERKQGGGVPGVICIPGLLLGVVPVYVVCPTCSWCFPFLSGLPLYTSHSTVRPRARWYCGVRVVLFCFFFPTGPLYLPIDIFLFFVSTGHISGKYANACENIVMIITQVAVAAGIS